MRARSLERSLLKRHERGVEMADTESVKVGVKVFVKEKGAEGFVR